MNVGRLCVMVALAMTAGASPCRAQDAAPQPVQDKSFERARVKLAEREVHGRLLRFDSETVTLEVDTRRIDLPMASVLQIDVTERDSLRNGAIFGAL